MTLSVKTLIVFALASFVATSQPDFFPSSVSAQDSPKSAQESRSQRYKSIDPGSPDTLEQLLSDPLFDVEEGRDFAYYSKRAVTLTARLHQLLSKRSDEILFDEPYEKGISSLERQEQFQDRQEKYRQIVSDCSEKFYEKFGAVFDPIFRRYCDDASLGLEDSQRAFSVYINSLKEQKKYAELSSLRAAEIAKAKAAREASDDAAFEKADARWSAINSLLYGAFLRTSLNFDRPYLNEDKKEDFKRLGDELAEAVRDDPKLIIQCEEFYVVVGRHVDSDIALDFRKKVLPYFDEKVATKETERRHGHPVHDVKFVLPIEPTKFDESILVVPLDETDEFYKELRSKIHKAQTEYQQVVHSREELADVHSKVWNAENKIALFLELNVAKTGKRVYKEPLYNGALSDEDCAVLKARLEEESKKTSEEANVAYMEAIKTALLARELRDAARKSDEEALKVCDKIIEKSFNDENVQIIPFGRVLYQQGKSAVAKEFVARAILKSKEKGLIPEHLSRFLAALEADDIQNIMWKP